jgi:hypothetical protein
MVDDANLAARTVWVVLRNEVVTKSLGELLGSIGPKPDGGSFSLTVLDHRFTVTLTDDGPISPE